MTPGPTSELRTARDALVFWAIGALLLGMMVVVHVAAQILLLTFGGVLFGTTLRGAAEWCSRRLRIGIRGSLVVCIAVVQALCGAAMLWIVPLASQEAGELGRQLAQAAADLQARLASTPIGRTLATGPSRIPTWLEHHAAFAGNFLIATVGVLGAVLYVVFVALYFAFDPRIYRWGALALVPPAHRARAPSR